MMNKSTSKSPEQSFYPQEDNKKPFFSPTNSHIIRKEVLLHWHFYALDQANRNHSLFIEIRGLGTNLINELIYYLAHHQHLNITSIQAETFQNFFDEVKKLQILPQSDEKEANKPECSGRMLVGNRFITLLSNNSNQLLRINSIIDSNLDNESFKGSDLAKSLRCCEMQLHRKLKKCTGFSTANYIRTYRLYKGMNLLQQEDCTVSEVAFMVGFRSLEYFTRCFKHEFGESPSALKNRSNSSAI